MTQRYSAGDVERFLTDELGLDVGAVEPAGAGAWSECFGFMADGQDLVVRVGSHSDDFARDDRAHDHAGPDLPIPRTLQWGEGLGGYYAISERARGTPLEEIEPWESVAPAVADLLEAMRTVEIVDEGWGAWHSAETPPTATWEDFLLSADDPAKGTRIAGWREKLDADAARARIFADWYRELEAAASVADVPRSLLHCDLVNRNVHVDDGVITGVFDWGCSVYGDHLYELGQLEFWDPVLPHVRSGALRAALEDRWRARGVSVPNHDDRMAACHLHNGVVHLAYNAHLGDWANFAAVDARLRELLHGFG